MQFMAYMKTPQYKASLQQLLEQEKVGVYVFIMLLSKTAGLPDTWKRCCVHLNSSAAQADGRDSARVLIRMNAWGFNCWLRQSLHA